MNLIRKIALIGILAMVSPFAGCSISSDNNISPNPVKEAIIINHNCAKLANIPTSWIDKAKQTLHIAYGYTSHGSQLITGINGLVTWEYGGSKYAYSDGGAGGTLDLKCYQGNFGGLGIANGLELDINSNTNYDSWHTATRAYLATNPGKNVIMWAWCYGVNIDSATIATYLSRMNQLEQDFPDIKFVYMTGRTNDSGLTGNDYLRNKQIRDYCVANNKILYDFFDIESYDPDGNYYVDKLCNENCDYDSNNDGIQDANWAVNWQNAHPGEWYNCISTHSKPLNANLKAYAAWWLWARLAGWDGK